MVNTNKLQFLSEFNENQKTILIREGLNGNIIFYIVDNNSKFFPLSESQFYDVYSRRPHKGEIYFQKPQSKNGRLIDLGDFKHVCLNDLLVDQKTARDILSFNHSSVKKRKRMPINERNKKWQEKSNELRKKHPGLNDAEIANKLLEDCKTTNPELVTKRNGGLYSSNTILKNIRKPRK